MKEKFEFQTKMIEKGLIEKLKEEKKQRLTLE